MNSNSDLDTSSQSSSHVELVDSNPISMIRIILYVTLLYIVEYNYNINFINHNIIQQCCK